MTRISRITTPRATVVGFLLLAGAMFGFAALAGIGTGVDNRGPVMATHAASDADPSGPSDQRHPCAARRGWTR